MPFDLGVWSRMFILDLIGIKGNITRKDLRVVLENHSEIKVEIGRGATPDDFIDVMIKEGVLNEDPQNGLRLTDLGNTFVEGLVSKKVSYNRFLAALLLERF